MTDRLTHDQMLRYSRHLIMPEVTMNGQLALGSASVLLVGVGGLGSPVALYLAAAGIGQLGLVDFDDVDLTNLQRQIIFGTSDIGSAKTDVAAARLRDLNPEIEIVPHNIRLNSANAMDILDRYDIVVDGSDNFPTRYLVNDACVLLGKPNVHGSVYRFEGQATVFGAENGPCYRCLYPEPPPPHVVPSCAEGGVLGVLPAVIGSIQAIETTKLILGRGDGLAGRLLLFDALKMSFREFEIRKSPECPVCGPERSITQLIDYETFCGVREPSDPKDTVPEITAVELAKRIDAGEKLVLLDVREPHEYQICHLGGKLMPVAELPSRIHEIDSASEIVVYCSSGARSVSAVQFLRRAGFEKVWHLRGGIFAWSDDVDPNVPKY
ncbi:MAG: molybdopterin-synthase adenylyltransferase MoeB [Candidatus Latescibacterota bacterium]|nr:MAG: molybdopterin-synthase adenylyltransferase MoeB [Candidatus Latescibacterota bacterium]